MRRRKRDGTWFPMLGSTQTIGDDPYRNNRVQLVLSGSSTGQPSTVVRPITFDLPQDANDQTAQGDQTLSEIMGNEYIIKRILGSLLVGVNATQIGEDAYPWAAIEVAAGFFVARAEFDDTVTNQVPIGWENAEINDWHQYSPGSSDTIREPWMWRRSWLLTPSFWHAAQLSASPDGEPQLINQQQMPLWPFANWQYNQLNVGPTVDIKSRRRVGQDDRLWLAVSHRGATRNTIGEEDTPYTVNVSYDLRMYGALRKAKNTGNF